MEENNKRGYDLNIKPYGGSSYDIDAWYAVNEPKTTSITMYFPTNTARDRIKLNFLLCIQKLIMRVLLKLMGSRATLCVGS